MSTRQDFTQDCSPLMPSLDDLEDEVELSPLLGSDPDSSTEDQSRGRRRVDMSGNFDDVTQEETSRRPAARVGSESEDGDGGLMYGAQHVIMLFVPVSLCMAVVVITVESVKFYTDQSDGVYLIYAPFTPEAGDSGATTFSKSLQNALIIIGVVIVMTVFIIVLYKYKCYKFIQGWLLLSSLLLLFFFSYMYLEEVLRAADLPMDYVTAALIIWNFGSIGIVAMHWKGPLIVQQAYCIAVSSLMALVFLKYLPEWTVWIVLALLAVWDLVAVLHPKGPLRFLVETAQSRNEPLFPSLIYSSTVMYSIMVVAAPNADGDNNSDHLQETELSRTDGESDEEELTANEEAPPSASSSNQSVDVGPSPVGPSPVGTATRGGRGTATRGEEGEMESGEREGEEADEQRGVKLGLGDFIFYSLLIGRASSNGDWNTTIACFVAILIGLCFTLVLLAVFRKALPALPISIAFGLVFNFATAYVISPFVTNLSANQLYL